MIPIEPHAKMVDHEKDSPIVRDRGRQKVDSKKKKKKRGRQKETISESIKRHLEKNVLSENRNYCIF